MTLAALAAKYGTDKGAHGYLPAYEMHLAARRERVARVLEIGIGGYADPHLGGASLRMWRDYFPNAQIVGLDIHPKLFDGGERVSIRRGSQTDETFLRSLSDELGPFDVIIDDGSHANDHRNFSFGVLIPLLASDGIYVLEDLHTSYLPKTYGGDYENSHDPKTSIGMLIERIDGLNHQYIPKRAAAPLDALIQTVCFHPKIAFVYRGHNEQDIDEGDRRALEIAEGEREERARWTQFPE